MLRCHSSLTAFNLLNHPHYGIINGSGDPVLSTLGADIAVEIINFRFASPFKGLKAGGLDPAIFEADDPDKKVPFHLRKDAVPLQKSIVVQLSTPAPLHFDARGSGHSHGFAHDRCKNLSRPFHGEEFSEFSAGYDAEGVDAGIDDELGVEFTHDVPRDPGGSDLIQHLLYPRQTPLRWAVQAADDELSP